MNPDMVLAYLGFVQARHEVWEARQAGRPQPWTTDPIVASRKFTNVYRVLDWGSQFVGRELLSDPTLSPRERLFRAFLYRHTGRPEPWEWFLLENGRFPLVEDLPHPLLSGDSPLAASWRTYRGAARRPVFTGAYLVFPQSQVPGTDKLDSILDLAARLFHPDSETDVMPDWEAAETQADRYAVLRRNKGVADFMSMQVLTDWGYLTEDREDEFVVPGPGAVRGAKHLAPSWAPLRTVEWAHRQLAELDIRVVMPDGRLRAPSLMDAQNTLCEFSKYVRYMDKPTARPYRPAHPGPQPPPWLPPRW